MSEKHSPGPWWWLIDENHRPPRMVLMDADDGVIIEGTDEPMAMEPESLAPFSVLAVNEADRRLIAAAPEMLALLREVKRWSDRELRSPCDDVALDDLLARIDGG
jgi:hypothetical protein